MISEDTLLQGSWYALEQAGRLLRSAVILFDGGDPSTALVLAMFGREELGRSQILRDHAAKVRAGEKLTVEQIRNFCEDHIAKQEAAALSTTLRVYPNTQINAAVQTRVRAGFHSGAGRKASAEIEKAIKAKRKRDPKSRHDARVQGLYVDLDYSGTSWVRPASLSAQAVRDHIDDAVGDYVYELDRLRNDVIEQDFPEMAAARARMNPIPVLPVPSWPALDQDAG
jgi:AbiV family abortive infection protein